MTNPAETAIFAGGCFWPFFACRDRLKTAEVV